MKNTFKSYAFWVSLSSAVVILVQSLAELFGFTFQTSLLENVVMAICGVLVVLGIVKNPLYPKAKETEKIAETTEDVKTDEKTTEISEIIEETVNSGEEFGEIIESETDVIQNDEQTNEPTVCKIEIEEMNSEMKNFETEICEETIHASQNSNNIKPEDEVVENNVEKTDFEAIKTEKGFIEFIKKLYEELVVNEKVVSEEVQEVNKEEALVENNTEKEVVERVVVNNTAELKENIVTESEVVLRRRNNNQIIY